MGFQFDNQFVKNIYKHLSLHLQPLTFNHYSTTFSSQPSTFNHYPTTLSFHKTTFSIQTYLSTIQDSSTFGLQALTFSFCTPEISMATSRPIRAGSASQASFRKLDSVNARDTHIYKATEDITIARVYEEDESGYAGIEGTFLDGSNAEQVVHAVLPDKHVQANLNLYDAHQRLTELYLEERFKGTVIQCSGTITMTILASGSRIKKYFAMEVKDARIVSEPAQGTRAIQKDIFPTVKLYKKGGIRAQLDLAYGKSSKTRSPPSPRTSRKPKRHHPLSGSGTDSDHNSQEEASTPEIQEEVEDLALVMNRSLSTSDDSSTMQGLSVEQIATLKEQEWQPRGIQPSTSPWSSTKNPTPVADITRAVDRLRPTPTASASAVQKNTTASRDAIPRRSILTSSQGSQESDIPLTKRRAMPTKPQSSIKHVPQPDPFDDFLLPLGVRNSPSSSSSSLLSTATFTKPKTYSSQSTVSSTKPIRSTQSTASSTKPKALSISSTEDPTISTPRPVPSTTLSAKPMKRPTPPSTRPTKPNTRSTQKGASSTGTT
ncbi:MAG: hypothetical protein J3R72DRAFT_507234 [Linnemannia gamsii]|nr:MAG: hypothetical protein J3R72DRAFT_507234 [Linnemannia gamsii]